MGAVFFITLLPAILVILGIIVTLGIIGIVVLIAGIGGSIVSAAALKNKPTKKVSLLFFVTLFLLGLSCVAVLVGIFTAVYFFVTPTLILVGIVVVVLGIVGIIKALSLERNAAKISLTILLSLSTVLGAIVLAIGSFLAFA